MAEAGYPVQILQGIFLEDSHQETLESALKLRASFPDEFTSQQ